MPPLKSFLSYWRGRWRDFTPNARHFLAYVFLFSFFGSAYGVLFNLFLVSSGYGESAVGKFLSVSGLAIAAVVVPCGLFSDRMGYRRALIIATFVACSSLLARVFAPDSGSMFVLYLIGGAAAGLSAVTGAPFLMENSRSKERTDLFSVNFALMLVAGVLGSGIGGFLPDMLQTMFGLDVHQSYQWTLAAISIGSFSVLIPISRMVNQKQGMEIEKVVVDETSSIRNEEEITAALSDSVLGHEKNTWNVVWKFVITSGLIGAGAGLVIPFFNLYFSNRFNMTSGDIGVLFAIAQIFTALAALLGPALSRRFGKVNTVVIMQIASLPFLVTLGFETGALWLASLSFFARATFMQASSPLTGSLQMELIPAGRRALANGLNSLSWNLCWAMTTALSGELMERVNYAVPYYITAGFYLVSTVLFYIFFWKVEGITLFKSMRRGVKAVISVPRRIFPNLDNHH